MLQELVAKRALYEAKKVEIGLDSHENEIIEKVKEFRIKKEQEILDYEKETRAAFDAQKLADETKVNNYLELLDELISEAKEREIAAQEPVQDNV